MSGESFAQKYPDGVWETTGGLTDADARQDWPVLRDAPGWQRKVTGPSGHVWTWRPWPRFPDAPITRFLPFEDDAR